MCEIINKFKYYLINLAGNCYKIKKMDVTRDNMENLNKEDTVEMLVKANLYLKHHDSWDDWKTYVKQQEILQLIINMEAPLQQRRAYAYKVSTNISTREQPLIKTLIFKLQRLNKVKQFYKWASYNGVRYDCFKFQKFPDLHYGLIANEDIIKDDLILSIPRKLMLTGEHLDCTMFDRLPNMKLVLALIEESLKPDSFWRPYIDILPNSYNTVLYFTVEEMSELNGSNALPTILEFCKNVTRTYVEIYYIRRDMPQFNYDLFRWAVSTVMTRENLIPRSKPLPGEETPSTIAALIPFWDMANHRNGSISSFFNVETQEMESKAQEDFKKGEQVFIHYGDRSNAELMTHNGFINAQNPKDSVTIKLGLSTSDALFAKRNQLLQLLNIPKTCELKVLPPPEHISSELLGFVRVFNMNEEQLDHWITSERAMDLLHIDCALETELESKTWQYLQIRLMLLLRAFFTTLEDDENLFEGLKKGEIKPARTYIQMMILEYRILEKRILTAALDYAKQRTKA
ncbi:actin-histidine N-methyltransferase isoform X2 [Calliphora vicina]|uniref:actin-histidine N-methyltransferase isoform X2 n=1 Tax=Calliphora vicina TaxID=7373 RepID=UPI00325AAA09